MPLFTRLNPSLMQLAFEQSGTDAALNQAAHVQQMRSDIALGILPQDGPQGLLLASLQALQKLIVAHHTYEKACTLFNQPTGAAISALLSEGSFMSGSEMGHKLDEIDENYLKATRLCSYVIHYYTLQMNPSEVPPNPSSPKPMDQLSSFSQSIDNVLDKLKPLCTSTLWEQGILSGRALAQTDILSGSIQHSNAPKAPPVRPKSL